MEYYEIYYWTQSGNIISGYCCFYDYLISEVKEIDKETMKIWNIYKDVVTTLHYFWVFEDTIFISEKPTEMSWNNKNQLHADLKPSVKYADGYSMYNLNGVICPEWLVMKSSQDISVEEVLKIDNVEVRTQGIKKIGLERLENHGKLIDEVKGENPYKLIDMSCLFENKYTPLLIMRNPSVPLLTHAEWVGRVCKTVRQSLNWRAFGDIKRDWMPSYLT
jgi:hypothetical protein